MGKPAWCLGRNSPVQPVVRGKLAIAAQIEAVQAWTEQITHLVNVLSHEEQSVVLAGPIALLNSFTAWRIWYQRSLSNIWRASYHKTGMGRVIEAFQKSNKFAAILGGSEEIMADLGMEASNEAHAEPV